MNCPECGGKTSVNNTRCTDSCDPTRREIARGLVERHRACIECDVRFKTEERIVTEFSKEMI